MIPRDWPSLQPTDHSLQRELQQLTDTSGASGHQKLRVCDVCGAYLSVLDSDRRLADHFGGKVCLSAIFCSDMTSLRTFRCILAITSSEICFRSSKRIARSARCRHRQALPLRLHRRVERHRPQPGAPLRVAATAITGPRATNIGTEIEATSGTVPRDMSTCISQPRAHGLTSIVPATGVGNAPARPDGEGTRPMLYHFV